jgi:hypothetical protein
MVVTAKFITDRIDALPNVAGALTLRLYNDDAAMRQVTLSTSGALHDHTKLDLTAASLETNQIVDVPVTVFLPSTVEAGTHTLTAEVQVTSTGSETTDTAPSVEPEVVIATATIELAAHTDYTLALQPKQSRGSSSGRHAIRLANTGNVAIAVGLSPVEFDDAITVELGETTLTVPPGATHETPLRITPTNRYWSGPRDDHQFAIEATSVDGRREQLTGVYQQRPRVPNWLGPAAAGALAAIVVGAIVWFAFLQPWVEDTAEQAAADAIELDRTALNERIAELEAAAAEAEELPLGTPTDIRLDVEPAGGNSEQSVEQIESGMTLSITDLVLQNPTGAVGTVSWLRGDEVILRSELANFRDFDLHFVAPYQFSGGDELVLEVDCRTPGAGESTCAIGASFAGFIDETD